MRLIVATFSFLLTLNLSAQKANSLLWEISGNGLEGNSYLYGTMHVSKKIAFHLDDVFYQALEASETVALESDPATWLESDIGERSRSVFGFETKGFYKDAFHFNELRSRDIARLLATDEGLINGILYRTNEYAQNFEEDTYLDMFIYRAGRKQGKPVIALEDLEESRTLVALASRNAMKKKPDPWLQERMQREDLMSLMQNAYRTRNISLLDSIDRAMYTEHYLRNMLYLRNRNMTEKLDSTMRSTRVFAGIGAAHLPGDQGVIAMLREKGYTVRPLTSETTDFGKAQKTSLESGFRAPQLKERAPEDETFRVALPSDLYPVTEATHTTYLAPDLTNGAYFLTHRIPTFQFLPGRKPITLSDVEDLLFENIPGRTLEKKRIVKQGYPGIEVSNVLKNGDQQRYQIILTPLELFIFKLAGQADYVSRYGEPIFSSLSLATRNGKEELVSPFSEFRIRAEGLYRFPNPSRIGNRHLEGLDSKGGYYFMRKITLNDLDVLEQDAFELRQIQKRFYEGLGLTGKYGRIAQRSLQSHAPVGEGDTTLHLKSIIRANTYYLLGYVGADRKQAKNYLNSFRTDTPSYPDRFETIRDTALYFTTTSPVQPKKFVEMKSPRNRDSESPKIYEPYSKKTIYQYRNNEAISVSINKSHDLAMLPSLDSLWEKRSTYYQQQDFILEEQHYRSLDNGAEEMELILRDTASTRGFLIKNVLKGGLLYEVQTTIDSKEPYTRFVREFYENFRPMDTLIGRSPIEDKTTEFLQALAQGDSLALEGYMHVRIHEANAGKFLSFLDTVSPDPEQAHIRTHMLHQLAEIDNEEVKVFLDNYYTRTFSDGLAQAKIAQSVTRNADKEAAAKLLELLSQDLPLVSGEKEIEKIFRPFREHLDLAVYLYPQLLEYHGIEEYKPMVVTLLSEAMTQGVIDQDAIQSDLPGLITDAGIQLKRLLAFETRASRKMSRKHKITRDLLSAYLPILFESRDQGTAKIFFDRLPLVNDPKVTATHIALRAVAGLENDRDRSIELAEDLNSRLLFLQILKKYGVMDILPESLRDQQAIAEAMVLDGEYFDPSSDTIKYVGKRSILKDGEAYTTYYFKARNGLSYHPNPKMYLLAYPVGAVSLEEPEYHSDGWLVMDTRTDTEIMDLLEEQFLLSEHPRAVVYEPGQQSSYSDFGF